MKLNDTRLFDASGEQAIGSARASRRDEADAYTKPMGFESRLLRLLLRSLGDAPLRIGVRDSIPVSAGGADGADGAAGIRIANWSSLVKLFINPDLYFGDAYTDGLIEVEGDLVKVLETVFLHRRRASVPLFGGRSRLAAWMNRSRPNTPSGARRNIHQHYDIGNEFYQSWLDPRMVYTCAYFPDPAMTLEAAQVEKMDHVCRKLRLNPQDTVVEAGCGWGALALHMATRHGVRVKAFNISREQIAYARASARAAGVESRVEFIEDDYRSIDGRFDVFVSIGMLEHVGQDHHRELGRVIDRCLNRNGRGLIHSIGQNQRVALNPWIEKRIFPGAYPPTLSEMAALLEAGAFSVIDVENLRLHYALTLEHWLRNFEAARERVRAMFDERFVRAWRLYLAGSLAAFRTGELQLYQVLFTRDASNDVPWTRAHLYGKAPG
jgi:cyclopropane-fatty-acyl-phospholipid synthase